MVCGKSHFLLYLYVTLPQCSYCNFDLVLSSHLPQKNPFRLLVMPVTYSLCLSSLSLNLEINRCNKGKGGILLKFFLFNAPTFSSQHKVLQKLV